jgi:hypothetical protein
MSMEVEVRSPYMEANEVVEEEPKPRRSHGDSLHRGFRLFIATSIALCSNSSSTTIISSAAQLLVSLAMKYAISIFGYFSIYVFFHRLMC